MSLICLPTEDSGAHFTTVALVEGRGLDAIDSAAPPKNTLVVISTRHIAEEVPNSRIPDLPLKGAVWTTVVVGRQPILVHTWCSISPEFLRVEMVSNTLHCLFISYGYVQLIALDDNVYKHVLLYRTVPFAKIWAERLSFGLNLLSFLSIRVKRENGIIPHPCSLRPLLGVYSWITSN